MAAYTVTMLSYGPTGMEYARDCRIKAESSDAAVCEAIEQTYHHPIIAGVAWARPQSVDGVFVDPERNWDAVADALFDARGGA